MDPSQSESADPTAPGGPVSAAPTGPHSHAPNARRTLPPPEWMGFEGPRSAASIALGRLPRGQAISRKLGARAELASLFARMHAASRSGDEATERTLATQLARALVQRGSEFDQATRLARRALLIAEDPPLREELASWFAMLGEPALAAATLRPLVATRVGPDATLLLTTIGSLLARAGEATAARDAYEQALSASPEDPNPAELVAAIGAWAADVVPPEEAARLYLVASERRERLGDRAAAFEDALRAFEMAPESVAASDKLSRLLAERGRIGAADEVRREHARALGSGARSVHLRRLRDALKDGDLPRALGAALDARLDAELETSVLTGSHPPRDAADGETAVHGLDELLEKVGLSELVAARLELACDALSGRERSRARAALARLYAGPLTRPDRAAQAWADALIADPANAEARRELARHAELAQDYTELVEALIRVGSAEGGSDRAESLRTLMKVAEERLGDAALAHWAARRAASAAEDGRGSFEEAAERLEPRAKLEDQSLEAARQELEEVTGTDRVEPLTRILALLGSRPDLADGMLPVLLELIELVPEERRFQRDVERVLTRQGRLDELEAFYERLLVRTSIPSDRAWLGLALSSLRRRRGDRDGALAAVAPLVAIPGSSAQAVCMALLLAGQCGDEGLRARALLRLSANLSAPVRAVLASVAGELLLRVGELQQAKAALDQAVSADPTMARPIAARALVGLSTQDRWGTEAIERAMGVVVPRAELCTALAQAYDRLGEPLLALAFGQRRIALRPGDLDAARDRVTRSLVLGDADRLADALAWLFAQPQPLAELGASISDALRALAALDPARATVLARRALDVLGPRPTNIRLAVLSVADMAGERGLSLTVLERWLASGAASTERAEILLDLSRRRRASGDQDGSARSLMRAMREGAWGTAVLAELDVAPPPKTSDGEIALLVARAEALSALSEADQRGTALAWRELGAAYWDLAGDVASAVGAWERASVLDAEYGVENLASDLCAFAGVDLALERLFDFAERRSDPAEAARVLALTAALAVEAGKLVHGLTAALRALELDPTRADVLAVLERAASDDQIEPLERAYTLLGSGVLGRFGERAIHYRAARQLERRRALERALAHALRAFEAVPSEGVVYVMLARLAEHTGAYADVVRAFERVAATSRDPELRSTWLRRAASLPGGGEDGLRQKIDVILRAIHVRPDLELLGALSDACNQLIALSPEDRDGLELRVARALGSFSARLEGPEGARIAVRSARIMLESFGDPASAVTALSRAIECDASIDEYAEFEPHVRLLAGDAAPLAERIDKLLEDPLANVGPMLLAFAAELCGARGDGRRRAALLVRAACQAPEDSELVRRAERAARENGDEQLIEQLFGAIGDEDRIGALIHFALDAEARGKLPEAVDILERARAFEGLTAEQTDTIVQKLVEYHRALGQRERVEELIEEQIQDAGDDIARRSRLAADLAALVGARGDVERALSILEHALRDLPNDASLLGDYVAFARQIGDKQRLIHGLSGLVELSNDPDEMPALLRELAELLELSGDLAAASTRWSQLLQRVPEDPLALAALERESERRGDYEALLRLLAKRASLAATADDVRRIRLRRAAVLEHRLGRPEEARSELEALTATTGDHLSVLRVLADLNERLGAPSRAAPLWLRASAVTTDRDEASDLSCRACEAYLAAGDAESARRVLDGLSTWVENERVLKLAVDVERRRNSPLGLAEALDELSRKSDVDSLDRAGLLLEAARAWLAVGAIQDALERSRNAAELTPDASAQLFYRALQYQQQGAPGDDDGARALERLSALSHLSAEDEELRVFLVAEILRRTAAEDAGRGELERAERALGLRPLIALGLAERARREPESSGALDHFDAALGGDLRGLRTRGSVALAAAELANSLGERGKAQEYLELALQDPACRDRAIALGRELTTGSLSSERRARPTLDPGRLVSVERAPADAGRYSERPPAGAREERPLAPSVPPARDRISSLPPVSEPSADASSSKLLKLSAGEAELYSALASGSVEAGKALLIELENRPDRTRDLVSVCRRLSVALPGDPWALGRLHDAALADKNVNYARAIEHVIYALQPGGARLPPPPLEEQAEQPDQVRALLLREQTSAALEALALVWEGAEHVFRRDPSTYGVTGLERVPLSAPTPLARAYSAAARSLGMLRTPLFQRRSTGPITVSLALLSPPAIVLSGDVRHDTPELGYQLGVMLVGAMPQFALLIGSAESQARAVLSGLGFAFGPPEKMPSPAKVPSLAEVLWESIPARLQRRLRELCNEADALDYESAMRAARLAARRAGLFVSGDLRVAIRETCIEEGIGLAALDRVESIAEVCRNSASVRSLVQLATSPEYAQTRWQPARTPR